MSLNVETLENHHQQLCQSLFQAIAEDGYSTNRLHKLLQFLR